MVDRAADQAALQALNQKSRGFFANTWNGNHAGRFSDKPIKCDGKCQELDKIDEAVSFEVEVYMKGGIEVAKSGAEGGYHYTGKVEGHYKSGETKVNGHTVYYRDVFVPDKVSIEKKEQIKAKVGAEVETPVVKAGGEAGIEATEKETPSLPWSPSGDVPGAENH